jgi:hypothetical protein
VEAAIEETLANWRQAACGRCYTFGVGGLTKPRGWQVCALIGGVCL